MRNEQTVVKDNRMTVRGGRSRWVRGLVRLAGFAATGGLAFGAAMALSILPLLANGLEGTGAERKMWVFWVAWPIAALGPVVWAARRRRWEVIGGIGAVTAWLVWWYATQWRH